METFYEKNNQNYFNYTVGIDPTTFLEPLVKLLRAGATILDIGCGSGRDLLYLKNEGFQATGLDQSPSLAKLARLHSGCSVLEGDFESYDFNNINSEALVSHSFQNSKSCVESGG